MSIVYCDFCGAVIPKEQDKAEGDIVHLGEPLCYPEGKLDACDSCFQILWSFVRGKSLRRCVIQATLQEADHGAAARARAVIIAADYAWEISDALRKSAFESVSAHLTAYGFTNVRITDTSPLPAASRTDQEKQAEV
jgi:hypothetical protein